MFPVESFFGDFDAVTDHDYSLPNSPGVHFFKWNFENVITPIGVIAIIVFCSLTHIYAYQRPNLAHLLPESCFLIIVGLILQGFSLFFISGEGIKKLSPHMFQVYLLPLIMLDAGLTTPLSPFVANIGLILALSFLGTVIFAFSVGGILMIMNDKGMFGIDSHHEPAGLLLFSTVIAAVDPVSVLAVFEEVRVNQVLYIIVFGESLLNDSVSIVMFDTLEKFLVLPSVDTWEVLAGMLSFCIVMAGGLLVGLTFGILISYLITKTVNYPRHSSIVAIATGHLAYLVADGFHWSGVVAIFFYSLTCTKYMAKSLSMQTMDSIRIFTRLMARSAEAAVFILLGVSTLRVFSTFSQINWTFIVITLILCFACRTIVILSFVAISNYTRTEKISAADQFIMCYGGLRGAIAYALVTTIPKFVREKKLYEVTTIVLIYFTSFVVGATVKPLTNFLDIKKKTEETTSLSQIMLNRSLDEARRGIEAIAGTPSIYHRLGRLWKRLDYNYLSPWLIKDFNRPDSLQSGELQEAFLQLFMDELQMDETAMAKLRRYRYRFYRNAQNYRLRHQVEPSRNEKLLANCVLNAMLNTNIGLEIEKFKEK
ncbi:Na(+)/H(+) exchanger beta-like [Phlebotomus papatasi]|uniref:Na(+)/H(+) exchanger beta-like n=1 Tax=Phlebotomus papatasi TaxID=29031 RepID=UPI00248408C1|nr:Na(+)/H(+) exchanger beta-like [Phlebotomus papatasi]